MLKNLLYIYVATLLCTINLQAYQQGERKEASQENRPHNKYMTEKLLVCKDCR